MAGRGQRQSDAHDFRPQVWPTLREAAAQLQWLLSRGFTLKSSLKLVGDRHGLLARQREALSRGGCTQVQAHTRAAARLESIEGQPLFIDGFNILITVEAALAGGVLVCGQDGALRDMASVHGSYRRVTQTHEALDRIYQALQAAKPSVVTWYFDRPVSNSGRAAQWVRVLDEASEESGPWQTWTAACVNNPDQELMQSGGCVASSDAWVLDESVASFALTRRVLEQFDAPPQILDLRETPKA